MPDARVAIIYAAMDESRLDDSTCRRLGLMCPLHQREACDAPEGESCIFVALLRSLTTKQEHQATPDLAALRPLSLREREVLKSFLLGYDTEAIARELFISPHTVRNHFKAIFRKVEVDSRVELVRRFQHIAEFL